MYMSMPCFRPSMLSLFKEAAWPSGQRLDSQSGGPGFESRSGYLLYYFVLGHPEFKSPAMLINSQLLASCQLRFLIHAVMLYLNLFVSKYLSGVPVN